MKTSAKLIGNLVHRVSVRLPYKSGRKIEVVEHDPIVKQTVAAIIELSKYKLTIVANTLGYVLESVSKTHQIYEQNVPVEIMQSKLFVLRLLSACMQHHWQYCRELEQEKNKDIPASELNVVPPPLDAALVTFMLVLMSRYITQYHLIEESTNMDQSNNIRPIADFSENEYGYTYDQIKLSLITDIYKAASKILYYISASNWDACYSKIKNAVLSLDSVNNTFEKVPPEIRMLESSCLTRDRLVTVISELSPYFMNMRNEGKLIFAKMMRKAIWKWIDEYPSQFIEVCASDSHLISGSEVFFDMCSATSDNSRKRAVLWPLQTILLVLSPDFLTQAYLDNHPVQNRRTSFLNLLKKSLQATRNSDIAAVCYVDLCKAATHVPPRNESILRSIAMDIEMDLKEKVWDLKKIPADNLMNGLGYNIDQYTLTADYLLSSLRLQPEKTFNELIPSCIQESAPILFKLAFVKSCLILVQDEKPLPWNPSISSMYDGLGPHLRKLFLQTVHLDLHNSTLSKKKDTHSNHNNRVELLLDALKLFRLDTRLAFRGGGDKQVEQNSSLLVGLMTLFQHPVPRIKQGALDLLVKMHQIEDIMEWGPEDTAIFSFWKISSPVILNLAQKLLDNKSNNDALNALLQLLNRLLSSRNAFLKSKKNLLTTEYANMRERLQATVALEIALLFSLCSSNKDICDEATQCIALLCNESRMVDMEEGRESNVLTISHNIEIYEELSSSNSRFIGRKAQQKRIRKYLRMLPHHTPGNLTAWEEAWKRWKQLTAFMGKLVEEPYEDTSPNPSIASNSSTINSTSSTVSIPVNKKLPIPRSNDKVKPSNTNSMILIPGKTQQNMDMYEEKAIEWQNFTGFLAALGGCCLQNSDMTENPDEIQDVFQALAYSNKPFIMVDRFIYDMTEMLVSDNVYVSEGVKDTLGNDLSPALYVLLFNHLEKRLSKCFDANNNAIRSPQNKMFIEQSVLVLRLILDRLVSPRDVLLTIDFSTLIYQFADYLNKVPNTYITLRIKVKMCLLIEAAMQKKEQIVIRDQVKLRNILLEICLEWTSDYSTYKEPIEPGQQSERLQKDLDLASLKAIVGLLHQLPLHPVAATRPSDASQINSKLFLKYFGFFRKLLDKFKKSEKETATYITSVAPLGYTGSRDSSLKQLVQPTPNSSDAYQDIAQMKELTIMAMSHLLSANVDTGLKYSLTMGYDDDQETRKALMQVLTNILDQGTEFENLAENVIADRYEKLIDMLVDTDMEIVMSLCEVCPAQDITGVAGTLLMCFESREKVVPLLKAVVQKEISLTEQEATLFRGTTIATRILSIFAKNVCLDYVRITLQPAMIHINNLPEDQLGWELDPLKVGTTESLRNRKNVVRATEIFLDAICSSVDSAPRAFREELALISEEVGLRFPEAKFTAVGGFVFLRLFGPAILTPENAGFSKQAIPRNSNVRKILLQATRVMQNLANNILFGSKETHMIVLNDFLTLNIYKVTNFLREMSTAPPKNPKEIIANVRVDQTGYVRLHKYLSDNLERMSRNLTNRKIMKASSFEMQQAVLERKKVIDQLSKLLAQLGRPTEIPKIELAYTRSIANEKINQIYNEFMRRNAHRDLSVISTQNVFYMAGTSKEGYPVFYFICSAMGVEEMDFELLVYYMLRVMEPQLNNPFELVFDLTDFSALHSIPVHWMSQFFELVFKQMNDYLVSLHLYNPNSYLQKYIRKLPQVIVNKLVKRAHFSISIAELSEHIAPSMIKLPKETVDLEKETSVTIYPVSRLTNLRTSIPVIIKIGPEHMQVITMKKQEIVNNVSTILRDVYHLSNIEDVFSLPSSKSEYHSEISIKYDKGKSTMVLSSVKRDIILTHLRHNKERYEKLRPTTVNERAIRPNDVPGRLLNMALFNLGSGDAGLRLAAYNLLHSLSLSFQFNIGNQLLNAKDLCIPSNSSNFIVSISESLAKSEIHLTLEFLNEAFLGFSKANESMCQLCLNYMAPWLQNLSGFARHSPDDYQKSVSKARDVLRLLVEITIKRKDLYKHIQASVWKTIVNVDEMTNMVIDAFVQLSIESGIGSSQAEIIADTLVTMSGVTIRGKIISRMRRVIESTAIQPCRNLTDHSAWPEICVLLRFILMLSFNNTGPTVLYVPEIFHIVSVLVVTGPTLIRSSVHELVVNTIHALCTTGTPLSNDSLKKLHFMLNELCDNKVRVTFGLTKQNANAFTITKDTTSDFVDKVNLTSLQNITRLLLDAMTFGAPNADVANAWRARWMGLVTSTAFYFNPAIQPRSFVALGCLAQDEVDDDLLYQILVALKGALAIFNESDSNLIISIMMCLSNIIDNLPSDSRYMLHLFWLAVALVQVGHPSTFQIAVRFLHSVLIALDTRKYFAHDSIEDVLLRARQELGEIAIELDRVCGINFNEYFSFSVAVILLKGLKQSDNKDDVYQCLVTFLEIDSKHRMGQNCIQARALGYFAGLLPFASKEEKLVKLLHSAGLGEMELNAISSGFPHISILNIIEIPDNSIALLFVSLLVNLLNASDNESERLFMYSILADVATCVPEVFALVYESLLPKMNQIVVNSQNYDLIDAIKNILVTACSEPAFNSSGNSSNKYTQKWGLENLRFSSLSDPTFGAVKTNVTINAKLASRLLGCVTEQQYVLACQNEY